MIYQGQKYNMWTILKSSGFGFWEVSNGKEVLKVSEENIIKGKFEGDLMFKVPQITELKKITIKKKSKVKKK